MKIFEREEMVREEGQVEGINLAKIVFRLRRDGLSNEEIAKECNIDVLLVDEILE